MSIWGLGSGAIDDFKDRGFRSWPNPFDGMVKDIKVLACQDSFQAQVTMYGTAFANWFWTNVVPSPIEITRKTLTGGYKCGFYFGVEWGSPIDVVWKDEKIGQMLLEISKPFTTTLFYMWAASSLLSGLATWQSLMYAMARCGVDHDECLLVDGSGEYFAGGASLGTPGFYSTLQDPRHMYASPGGAVDTFSRGHLNLNAYGSVYAGSCSVEHCEISFMAGTTILGGGTAKVNIGALEPGDVVPFSLSFSGEVDAGAFRINGDLINNAVGLQRSTIFVNRWTASWSPGPRQHNCTPYPVRSHYFEGNSHWWSRGG